MKDLLILISMILFLPVMILAQDEKAEGFVEREIESVEWLTEKNHAWGN